MNQNIILGIALIIVIYALLSGASGGGSSGGHDAHGKKDEHKH